MRTGNSCKLNFLKEVHPNAFNRVKLVHEYRDRIYIRKDIMFKLYEYGELNQSKLMSYRGLNNVKHKGIIDDLVKKEFIVRIEEMWGHKTIIKYRISEKGRGILREILEPYETLFPRGEAGVDSIGESD